nr:T9SS type A sorting domain-containing protein [Ignavibacterium sp.]
TFKENKFGLAIIDLNSSIVKNNTFDHNTYGGTILENNNTISNRVICNNYVSEFIGMDIKGNNQGAYINNQTFQSVYDVTLKPKGVAGQLNEFGQQGDAFLNYFSNTGNNLQHINTIGNTIQFDYFYPNLVQFPRCLPKCTFNNPNPCIAPNNLVTYETQGFPINCNSNGGGFDDFCHTISCLENIGISLNNLINIATQRPLTHQENSELNILKVKYDNGILIITRNFIENSDYSSATTFLQGINSTFSKRILFSVYLIQNDTTAALQVLAAYPSSTVDDQYFKTCQLIKLSLIQQNFILSIDQKNELLQIAESNQFCAGYAKGILTYCEGILFNPEIPDLLDPRSIESKKGSAILDQMEIIPNPSSGNIIINIPNQDYKSGILKIFSSTGLEIWDTKIYSKISTYTTSIEISGVYFISLTDETGFSQVKKLIIK